MATHQRLSLLWHLFATTQRVKTLLQTALTRAPLSADEYAVYSLLADEGPLAPKELATRLGMPVTTMSHYVRALVDRAHADRAPNPADGRSYLLHLTPAGRLVHGATARLFEQANARFLARLAGSEADEDAVRESLIEIGRAADLAMQDLAVAEEAA